MPVASLVGIAPFKLPQVVIKSPSGLQPAGEADFKVLLHDIFGRGAELVRNGGPNLTDCIFHPSFIGVSPSQAMPILGPVGLALHGFSQKVTLI